MSDVSTFWRHGGWVHGCLLLCRVRDLGQTPGLKWKVFESRNTCCSLVLTAGAGLTQTPTTYFSKCCGQLSPRVASDCFRAELRVVS